MKKAISFILGIALVCSISIGYCTTSYGEVVKRSSKDVNAKVIGDVDGSEVFSVDVVWGAMNFTYMKVADTVWNEVTHTYDQTGSYTYKWVGNGNVVTVINHSNTSVEANLTYTSNESFSYIKGKFIDSSVIKLPSAFGKDINSKKIRGSSALKLSGHLQGDYEEYVDIGNIRVEIN